VLFRADANLLLAASGISRELAEIRLLIALILAKENETIGE